MNTDIHACSPDYVDCCGFQDPGVNCKETVCAEQRIDCEGKVNPCMASKIEAETCSITHREELMSEAKYKTEAELIEDLKQKYKAEP